MDLIPIEAPLAYLLQGQGAHLSAEDFLRLFPGHHTYATLDDKRVTHELAHYHEGFELSHDQILTKLALANETGHGVFFCVNQIDKRLAPTRHRHVAMLTQCRAIWIDDDDPRDTPRADFPIPPNIIVNTSPGKFHYYWLTSTANYEQWNEVMNTMVSVHGCDAKSRDLLRILRVPSFYHHKRDPFQVKFKALSEVPYEWTDIVHSFPPVVDSSPRYTRLEAKGADRTHFSSIESAKNSIRSGANYHDAIRWLCDHYANTGGVGSVDIGVLVHSAMSESAVQDERWRARTEDAYLEMMIRHAIEFVEKNPATNPNITAEPVTIDASVSTIPVFPGGFCDAWPDPWPMIWKEWLKLPYQLEEVLLAPTFLSCHQHLLRGRYLNFKGRRPNMFYLCVAPSTGHKDNNSKDVIRSVSLQMRKADHPLNVFNNLLTTESNITADTSFLQHFGETNSFYWINTEATRVFQMLARGGNNAAVMGLSDKIIEVVEGHELTGKRKVTSAKESGLIQGVADPNVQIVFYCQPETIEQYIRPEIVDSGLFGRAVIAISEFDFDEDFSFLSRRSSQDGLPEWLMTFYQSEQINTPHDEKTQKLHLDFTDGGREAMGSWLSEKAIPIMKKSDGLRKVVGRMGITAEQLYCSVLGLSRLWCLHRDIEPIDQFDPVVLEPLLEYWIDTKRFAIETYIDQAVDPLNDAILGVIRSLVAGDYALRTDYEKIRREENFVPLKTVAARVNRMPKLKRMLDARGDARNVAERVNRLLVIMEKQGVVVTKDYKMRRRSVKFIGMSD